MTKNGRQKGTVFETAHKELRIVISRNRSLLPLRIAKWVLFLGVTRRLYGRRSNSRKWVMHRAVQGESILP
jgi:hypothetical protein